MIIGLGEWGFREMPIEEHFRIAKSFGFHFLEFGIGGDQPGRLPETLTDDDIQSFKQLGNEYDIRTPFCCIENDFTLDNDAAHVDMLERTMRNIRLAAPCGATHVRLFAGFTPTQQMTEAIWKQMLSAFESCDAVARGLGLAIAIETHGLIEPNDDGSVNHLHTVTTHRLHVDRLLRALPESIGINYDPGNIKAAQPDDPTYLLDLLDSRINYCHLKDWRRTGEGWQACAIGDDDLDYADLLNNMTYDGVYLIEYEPLEDTLDGIQRSLDYLKEFKVELRYRT